MTDPEIEISENERIIQESLKSSSSSKLTRSDHEQSSTYLSGTDTEIGEAVEETFLTERFIKEYNDNLEKRVQYLKNSLDALRNQLSEEKELWKKEVEEFNQMQAARTEEETSSLWNGTENGDCNSSEYYKRRESYAQIQAEQKVHVWRTIAMAEYKRRLLEVESMCNLELLRVKQHVQDLQPLQKYISEWSFGPRVDIKSTNSSSASIDDNINSKSTITLAAENVEEQPSTNAKENNDQKEEEEHADKNQHQVKEIKPNSDEVTPRSKIIYNDFAEVCAKMQNFMKGFPQAAAFVCKDSKSQSTLMYSQYSFH